MKYLLFLTSASQTTSNETNESGGAVEKLLEILKNPVFYIVVGSLVLLVLVFYLVKRFVKPRTGVASIVIRKGKIHRVITEKDHSYYLIPFIDKLGANINLSEREFSSDTLFINNGPDALYKVNYTLKYKVVNPAVFYAFCDNIDNIISSKLNNDLREYADKGNALVLVKDYRDHVPELLSLINNSLKSLSIDVNSLKINYIEPLGRK